jgi:hypothetical protein
MEDRKCLAILSEYRPCGLDSLSPLQAQDSRADAMRTPLGHIRPDL